MSGTALVASSVAPERTPSLEAEDDIEVVGEAAAHDLARIPALRPDVAVLDVRLPDGDG